MLAPLPDRARRLNAEEIAIAAFAHIAWSCAERDAFLFVTGLLPETVRTAARTPQFLAGVLDYVVSDAAVHARVAQAIRTTLDSIHIARRELLPSMAVSTTLDPRDFGPGPLTLRCEHCGKARPLDRRSWSHLPARVAQVVVPRCGPCGGGFDQGETWVDADGDEIDT